MSVSLSFVAFRDTEGMFKKMLDIKLYCEAQGVSYPKEVSEYFGNYVQESASCIKDEMLMVKLPLKEINNAHRSGFEIDIKDIPEGVKTLQAFLS